MNTMATVSEVLNELKKEGYTVDFNLKNNCLVCQGNSLEVYPEDFVVDRHYRFEGITDPADEAVVYAISSQKHNMKGTLVNGYGIYSDDMTSSMVQKLTDHQSRGNNAAEGNVSSGLSGDDKLSQAEKIDLKVLQAQIKSSPDWNQKQVHTQTVFKSEEVRISLMALHYGAELKRHTANGRICVQVLEGNIRFSTDSGHTDLLAGQMLTLQAGVPHSVTGLEESVFMLTVALT